MKNISMNGQNVRKTLAAAIAAMTMALTTSCGSVAEIQPSPAAAPAVTAAQNDVQPTETEAPAETAAPETEAPAESAAETKEETASSETAASSETKKPAQTTASNPAPSSSDNTSGGSTNNAPAAQTTAPETQPEQRVAQPIDMTVDRMLSSSVRELCDLSANDFEYVEFVYGTQVDPVGIKCASFPNYIFVPSTELVDGAPENRFEVPGRGCNSNMKYVIGDQIRMLNLMPGANVEGVATVGMTYTELRDIFANYGSDFKVFTGSDSLGLRAYVNINGRDWYFGFDLTDDQREEIFNRMQELAGDEVQVGVVNSYDYRVDISDIDPASSVAVLQIR